jgi:glucokinase
MHFLAIEIGGTKLQLFAGTGDGEILERVRFPVDRAKGGKGIRVQIESALPELIKKWKPKGIGVGFGGPVRWQSGTILRSHHVEGWVDYPLGGWLTRRTGLPAAIENDANVAALGEARRGAGREYQNVFYITLGSGVGGGMVNGGRIYHGATPGEVEIGHLRLDARGTIVEDRCSGWSMDQRVRREVQSHPDSALARLVRKAPPGGEARHLRGAIAAGDRLAESILGEHTETLAFALSHVVHLLHPEIIILGGGLSFIGEPLQARLAAALPKHIMGAFLPGPKIALSTLGEDAVPVGALTLAAQAFKSKKSA